MALPNLFAGRKNGVQEVQWGRALGIQYNSTIVLKAGKTVMFDKKHVGISEWGRVGEPTICGKVAVCIY